MTEFDDCYYSCIENIYEKQFKCFPNPFITADFVLLNSSQTKLSFCNKSENISRIDSKVCDKKCTKSCSQVYHTMSLDNKYYLTNSDSKIKIKFKSSQEFHYETEIKETFVLYLSNIGGLIALWFGLSFIDLASLIKVAFGSIKVYIANFSNLHLDRLKQLLNLFAIKINIKLVLNRFNAILLRIQRLKWQMIITVITIPILLYQLYELVDSYLQFSTEVSVELIFYRDSDNNIRYNVLPAITVCTDHIFEELRFNQQLRPALTNAFIMNDDIGKFNNSTFKLKSFNSFNNDLALYYLNFYYHYRGFRFSSQLLIDFLDVNDRQELDENMQKYNNISVFGFNRTKHELYVYEDHFFCIIPRESIMLNESLITKITGSPYLGLKCQTLSPIVYSVSPFGKCLTYLFGIHKSHLKNILYLTEDLLQIYDVLDTPYSKNRLRFLNQQKNTFSSLRFSTCAHNRRKLLHRYYSYENSWSFSAKLEKFEFQRLPKPYDTNCQKYGNSTRFQCLNECYFDGYMSSDIKCIPNSESLYHYCIERLQN